MKTLSVSKRIPELAIIISSKFTKEYADATSSPLRVSIATLCPFLIFSESPTTPPAAKFAPLQIASTAESFITTFAKCALAFSIGIMHLRI